MFLVAHSYQCFPGNCKRRLLLLGVRAMTTSSLPANLLLAEVWKLELSRLDNLSSISKDSDFRGHDSAFEDRTRQSQNVRVRFIPPEKKEIHELGSNGRGRKIVIYQSVKHSYAAPDQMPTIYSMQEVVSLPILSTEKTISLLSTDLHLQTATIAIAKGRSCTLTVTVEKISQSA
ncbi:LOW QUALITY PROTEIN: hypothetical protein NC651_019741 [Populus alba x Populus x berolinensis]|nr:LOW QUALITY PROTEIN: hypothetical protein NC651_019741 [Populus alba x Populus x berolinensis]